MTPTAVVKKLSEAVRRLVIDSEPGGWGRDDTACGAELIGAGRWSAARSAERMGLGAVEETPWSYPPGLYFNNDFGLAVRQHLMENNDDQ